MNNFKFTPGPWRITGSKKNIIDAKVKGEFKDTGISGIICDIWSKNEYDIKLILAAPEILEALIKYIKMCDAMSGRKKPYKKTRDLIEKATGKKWVDILNGDA
jgi:hypothetical protein